MIPRQAVVYFDEYEYQRFIRSVQFDWPLVGPPAMVLAEVLMLFSSRKLDHSGWEKQQGKSATIVRGLMPVGRTVGGSKQSQTSGQKAAR
jgi:hypothetical protein